MNKIEIGKRIKNRRISLGLTQNQVADGYMTRNMLSLIESGSALPSLETAEYLSEKLKAPLSFLLVGDDGVSSFEKNELIAKIRKLYENKNYKECLDAFKNLKEPDNELNYIYAYASFYYARSLTYDGSFEEAKKYLDAALEKAKQTVYDTAFIEISAPLYLAVATNVQSPLLELDTEDYEAKRLATFDYELYKYLTSDSKYEFTNQLFKMHVEAKMLMKKYHFIDAVEILKKIEERKTTEYNAFVLFGTYSDLESCYKQLGDFENAYKYSSKKFNLLNALGK